MRTMFLQNTENFVTRCDKDDLLKSQEMLKETRLTLDQWYSYHRALFLDYHSELLHYITNLKQINEYRFAT